MTRSRIRRASEQLTDPESLSTQQTRLNSAMNKQNLDLSVVSDVLLYLADTPFDSTAAAMLSGGNANFTYRLHLRLPYEGCSTLVLKHAKSYIASEPSVKLLVERQVYEAEALRIVKSALPDDSIVTVPTLHYHDQEMHVLIMDDSGEGNRTLKQLIIEDLPTPLVAEAIGTGLGKFLALVHGLSHENPELVNFFFGNVIKAVSAYVTYGRIVSTLTCSDGTRTTLGEIPVNVTQADLEKIQTLCSERVELISTTRDMFTMGDFWPGNMLVTLSPDKTQLQRIHVVDWEVAKSGVPGFDVGQFSAEIHLLRRFYPKTEEMGSLLLSAFLQTYRSASGAGNISSLAQTAAIHVGAHLVAWTPRVPWGSEEQTRRVVEEGVEYLLQGDQGDSLWLENSVVGRLFLDKTID